MKFSASSFLAVLSAAAVLATTADAISPLRREPVPMATIHALRGGAVVETAPVMVHQKKAVAKASRKKAAASSSSFPTEAIVGSIAMAAVERVVKKVFTEKGISFPAQLAGCVVLFFTLLMMDVIVPGSGESLYKALGPGTALLTKWLPVFFVPGLALLPLAPSVGSGVEVRVCGNTCYNCCLYA